ncbi:hypothetical protein [Flavobacterium suncheonense]|uniref:Uncharacterized protein n=1 Tax=Flavobacterium suncheonense GH29-5 = DSM 17707 TaxID=1121899 RepID=A0A0A2MNA8_9FLAO|nr:hypothetical protein [Flavobacterium suncheonense]KGO89760.1 hypothetical protein Q764_06115 [Flavobacterium suncheonense GH29-5 = DSM 17707]
MIATKDQKFHIRRNCAYNEDIKCEWVQWATGDNSKTSLNDLTFDQANKILIQQGGSPHTPDNWAVFDKTNKKHMVIISLMRQAQWVKPHDRYGEVADMERLSKFLQSPKSPITKPLQQMEPEELERIIKALKGIVKSKYK